MGMYGLYRYFDDKTIDDIVSGELNINDLFLYDKNTLDIDKSWQAIRYLLCGDSYLGNPPESYVVPLISDFRIEDGGGIGYFYLHSDQVEIAHDFMRALGRENFENLFKNSDMFEEMVYPIREDEDTEEFFEYIYDHFIKIKKFYENCVKNHRGIIFHII